MSNVPQTVSMTELRTKTKAVIQKAMASDEPVYIAYNSKLPVCLIRTDGLRSRYIVDGVKRREGLLRFAGHLKDSKAFSEGALEYQRKTRGEWER